MKTEEPSQRARYASEEVLAYRSGAGPRVPGPRPPSRRLLKWVAGVVHGLVARSPWLARRYLDTLGSVCRALPAGTQRRVVPYVLNAVNAVGWPSVDCTPRRVVLGKESEVTLTPHLGEADSEALLSRRLEYEREVFAYLDQVIDRYDVVVEIGANVGLFTLYFDRAMARKGGSVFAFEPSPEAYRRLIENLRQNAVSVVTPFQCAVGERTGFVTFYAPDGHLTNGSTDPEFAARFGPIRPVRVLMVDGAAIAELVPEDARLLIKIDVEGTESAVLAGLDSLIRARRPDIILEVLPTHADRLNRVPVLQEGYDYLHLTPAGPVARKSLAGFDNARDYALIARAW